MALNKKELSFDNSEIDGYVTTVDDNSITDEVYGEQINNNFWYLIDVHKGVTGSIFEEDGVIYVQKCLHGEYYCDSYDVYGDTDESTTILAHSTNTWTLCNTAPSFNDNHMVKNDNEFDNWLLEANRMMAHQGLLNVHSDYNVYEADLEQAQQRLKPSIRPPAEEDWKRMRKYFSYVPVKMVPNIYKYSTQYGVLPPSHLQKRFK